MDRTDKAFFPVWSCEDFPLRLPEGHPFPYKKYPILEAALRENGFGPFLTRCGKAEPALVATVHCPDYIERVLGGQLPAHSTIMPRWDLPMRKPF